MNFKSILAMAGLIAATLTSTAVHADIPGNPGSHYFELNNNANQGGKSMKFIWGDNHVKCVNINPGQIIRTNYIISSNNLSVLYGLYSLPNCPANKSLPRTTRQVISRADNKAYLQLKF